MSTARTRRMHAALGWIAGLGLAVSVTACGDDSEPASEGGTECIGAKCDAVDQGEEGDSDEGGLDAGDDEFEFPAALLETCEQRKDEAFKEGVPAFSEDHLRWSCADVPGTLADDRGQEYCEYFVIVQRPGAEQADVLGVIEEIEPSTEEEAQLIEVTPTRLDLTADEIEALDADPAAEAGRCVFTSWNGDVDACETGYCNEDENVFGIPVTDPDVFRMTFDANTYDAAEALVNDCMEYIPGEGDASNPDDPFHDDFLRACELNSAINETEYRKSDNTVCASALRLAECGCYLNLRTDLGAGLSQKGKLGFPLGGWEGREILPSGCRYESVIDGARQVVTCELTAAEVVDNATELKTYCAEKYADDVVVHVPVPAASIECEPEPDSEPYASTCAATPWNVTP